MDGWKGEQRVGVFTRDINLKMSAFNYLTSAEIAETTIQTSVKKVRLSTSHMLLLGFLAGAFIAFAAEGSNMAAFNLFANAETYGLGKVLAGAVFGTGLMLVVIAGGELFTGNTMIIAGILDKKVRISEMLRNWLFVYIGNLLGSVFIAYLMMQSGLFESGDNVLGAVTIKIAAYKVGLSFGQAFVLGIMCNWLVCLAVWMAYGAKDITGKILAIFFPIWAFVIGGFEHCVANMFYIPAGMLAATNPVYVAKAEELYGITSEQCASITVLSSLKNFIPVTIGNIIGGAVFIGLMCVLIHKKDYTK